jgi:hypothetical protein
MRKGKGEGLTKLWNSRDISFYNNRTMERKVSQMIIFNKEEKAKGWSYAGPLWTGSLWIKNLRQRWPRSVI